MYLLGSEDAKLRLETAKSFARLVSNLSCFEATSSGSQNVLLAAGEGLLKGGGYAGNLFGSALADNDACNAGSIQFLFGSQTGRGSRSGSSSSCGNVASGSGDGNRSTGFNSATSISYSQKQVNGILDFILFKARLKKLLSNVINKNSKYQIPIIYFYSAYLHRHLGHKFSKNI